MFGRWRQPKGNSPKSDGEATAPPPTPASSPLPPRFELPKFPPKPAPVPRGVKIENRITVFRSMVEMRTLSRRITDLAAEGLVEGPTHLGLGQEAVAAGFGAAMRADDQVLATYRGHNHCLARGVPITPLVAEVLGRRDGLMGGRGGSMALTSIEHNMLGSYAVIGANLTIANGAAWSALVRQTEQVVVCFFGDGATGVGAFHEALNLAALWQLPVVFVCENNMWSGATPIRATSPVSHPAADRASGYGLVPVTIDGNDADDVYDTARACIERARSGGGPAVVEARTYRQGGHAVGDTAMPRPSEGSAAFVAGDPIRRYRTRLISEGISSEELEQLEMEVEWSVGEAIRAALSSQPPDVSTLETFLYAGGGGPWRR